MAKRRKSRKSRSRRRGSHRARHANPHRTKRSHGRRRGHRRHRRNPSSTLSLRGFSPMNSIKSVAAAAAPVAVGYFGVNLVQMLVKRLFLDRVLATQSAGVQAAADVAARALIGVPAVTMLGSQFLRGKGGLIAAGAATNVVVNAGRLVAANVPGIPAWASETLGDWPGTPGVYGFMQPAAHPRVGVSDFAAPTSQPSAALPSMASGGRGMF